uniref:Uncharacterized protein n=1 Tax=Junco hyemalis TaxID=40217 RepID=A0A8C5IIX9_JUNHY
QHGCGLDSLPVSRFLPEPSLAGIPVQTQLGMVPVPEGRAGWDPGNEELFPGRVGRAGMEFHPCIPGSAQGQAGHWGQWEVSLPWHWRFIVLSKLNFAMIL